MCDIKPRELSVYIKRGKVILTPDKKVDDEVSENAEFLASRREASGHLNITIKEKKFTPEDLKKLERTKLHQDLNTRQKELETEELQEKIELLKIKKQMQTGYLIPVDLVKSLFQEHNRNITISFQQGAENLIIEISKKKKLTREESASLRKKLVDIINISVDESAEKTDKSVDNLVREFSKKRGVGERK